MINSRQTKRSFTQIRQSNSFSNKSLDARTLPTNYSVVSASPTDTHSISFTAAVTPTNVQEYRISPTFLVKKVTRSGLANMSNIQTFRDSNMKDPSIAHDDHDNSAKHRRILRPMVNIVRVSRRSKIDSADKANSGIIRQDIPKRRLKRVSWVTIAKIPTRLRRTRVLSADNMRTIHVNQSAMEMQPIVDRTVNRYNEIMVKTLPRNIVRTQSNII